MKKRAFITGITGQDGTYLAEHLVSQGYDVFGLVRSTSAGVPELLEEYEFRGVTLINGNLRDSATIRHALETAEPDEIYNLAAQSHVGISFNCPDETFEVNYFGVGRVLNEAMRINPAVRVYQASTSEMFGSSPSPQNETTPFAPVSPYAEAKLKAHLDYIVGYRERHGLFACSGILFNHESPRRGKLFVTRKITRGLSLVKLGRIPHLELGNLNAGRDWGFAGDYVKVMPLMLQQNTPDDFVIATGEVHTVREFVDTAANVIGMKISWRGSGVDEIGTDEKGNVVVRVNPKFYRPTETSDLLGDATKARQKLGWKQETSFRQLVEMMARSDFEALSKELGGLSEH